MLGGSDGRTVLSQIYTITFKEGLTTGTGRETTIWRK